MARKNKARLEKTSDPRTYKMTKRAGDLTCDYCPPHGGENASRKAKHGNKKPKYKNKRK